MRDVWSRHMGLFSRSSCQGEQNNQCGGCNILDGEVGSPCGTCGTLSCSGTNSLVCNENPQNACGGCGVLEAMPGDECMNVALMCVKQPVLWFVKI